MITIKLINIGFKNTVSANRIIAVISPEAAPVKRMVMTARDNGSLIDATCGRKTMSVIVTDSGHTILSAISVDKIKDRFNSGDDTDDGE